MLLRDAFFSRFKSCRRATSNYLRKAQASLEWLNELEGGLQLCASPRRLCVMLCSARETLVSTCVKGYPDQSDDRAGSTNDAFFML